jgi:2'-5' RNA ligase
MPRLFIALDLPTEARVLLSAVSAGIPNARWVSVDQLHLTLRFLGAVPDERLPELQQNLTRVAASAFHASLDGVGLFPPVPTRRKPARVLWAGLSPPEPVRALKQVIDEVLGPDPEAATQDFSPHVTLARFKEPPPAEPLARFLEQHRSLSCEPFAIESFRLYESRTPPTGPVYTARATYALRADAEAKEK